MHVDTLDALLWLVQFRSRLRTEHNASYGMFRIPQHVRPADGAIRVSDQHYLPFSRSEWVRIDVGIDVVVKCFSETVTGMWRTLHGFCSGMLDNAI
jgi:hypothetical protein